MFVGSLIVQSIRKILMLQTMCKNLHVFSVYDECSQITTTGNFYSSLFFSKLTFITCFFKKSKPPKPLNHNTRDTLENIA